MIGRVQALGLTRFSYPSAPGAFGRDGLDALRARLYDDRRMALRFHWFEHVTLPGLRAQTDPDFTLVVLTGDALPERHRDRLAALLSGLPQARIVTMPEGRVHREACRAAMIEARDPAARVVAEFRLDDDDGVAAGFVADLRRRFETVAPLFEGGGRVTLDYCRGLLLRTAGAAVELRPVMARLWTPALVTYRAPGDDRSLLDAPHLDLWKLMPVLSLRHPAMFVRGAHADNASAVGNRWDRVTVRDADQARAEAALRRDFRIDLDAFRTGWERLRRSC